jgi:type II secretory pathway pseudopilin PulG
MKRQQGGITLVELLVIITIVGLLVALLLPAMVKTLGPSNMGYCQVNLEEIHAKVQLYRAKNGSAPPIKGGSSDASSWGMYLKDNNKGAGKLNNSLFFCPVLDRMGDVDDEDAATDDGDYMFNVGTDEVNPLSEDAPPDTILAADCVTPDASMSNHGDPAKKGVNVLLKNGALHKVRKGDDLFERLQKANMVGGADSGNPHCPSPEDGQKETPESSDAK